MLHSYLKARSLRFSLRTLMLFSLASCLLIAWYSNAHQQHAVEQQFIDRMIKTLPGSEVLSVVTNDQSVAHGQRFL
ncbi:hypothetical protein [Planctomycetes bacterium K23_9]|uniref:Uncharacterized protein n=1 Tax=Stieleria marina TaxID=1930275 RepID=A0A517P0V6_9BACT|nr:hypothetical protein K239x_50310 [Planctomycetes bacterium K23_9]